MNKKIIWIIVAVLFVLLAGYFYQTVPEESEVYTVTMVGNDGSEMGTVQLSETSAGILLNLDIKGLTPDGEHAIHIHETGDCSPQETFENAGGHYNPEAKSHGLQHPEGHHAGDMPNLKPDANGAIQTRILNQSVTLHDAAAEEGSNTVFDEDGSAIVIHAGADDHMSQPSGAAGSRIACGVISK